jgi:hypothetical protein
MNMGEVVELTLQPADLRSRLDKVPQVLVRCPQWVAWESRDREGERKPEKVPIDPKSGRTASISNRDTWGSFREASARCEKDQLDGIGFVLTADDDLLAIDLDGCRNPETKKLTKVAIELLRSINSYAEVSPSGTGIHIWVEGDIPRNVRQTGIEIYRERRFMTVTGRHLAWCSPPTIAQGGRALAQLFRRVTAERLPSDIKLGGAPTPNSVSEAERRRVIREATDGPDGAKFSKLWTGDWSDYPSPSEADLALCRILARHCGCRNQLVDALFRTAKLFRAKWDRVSSSEGLTYGQMTVSKAVKRARRELKAKFAIYSGNDVTESRYPLQRWVIDELCPAQSLNILVGNSNIGKSPLVYQAGICVASGVPFLGREVSRGRVLYFDFENGRAQQEQLVRDISEHLELEKPPANFLYWNLNTASDRWGRKGHQPLDMVGAFRPDLVVLDSLSAYEPKAESRNWNATEMIQELRNASRECGCSVLMTHHLAKLPRNGKEMEGLETCSLGKWFSQARGASALINATDVRLGVEKPSRSFAPRNEGTEEVALVLRGFARITGEIPLMYVARVFQEGQPVGYRQLTGPGLLLNPQQELVYAKLPKNFRFKDARMLYGKRDQATVDFLRKCEALRIVAKRDVGYEKIGSAQRSA